jgi:hypothetical protein
VVNSRHTPACCSLVLHPVKGTRAGHKPAGAVCVSIRYAIFAFQRGHNRRYWRIRYSAFSIRHSASRSAGTGLTPLQAGPGEKPSVLGVFSKGLPVPRCFPAAGHGARRRWRQPGHLWL